jgi:hypothetical protein
MSSLTLLTSHNLTVCSKVTDEALRAVSNCYIVSHIVLLRWRRCHLRDCCRWGVGSTPSRNAELKSFFFDRLGC